MKTTLLLVHPGEIQKTITLKKGERRRFVLLFILKDKQKAHLKITVNQQNPESLCQTKILGVVSGQAQVEIEGLNRVGEGAFGTESSLEERVLLLGKKAKATLKPFLEMDNNRIKLRHAATAGKIDPGERFYFQSRGIRKRRAEKLLAYFFLKEAINQVKEKDKKEKIKNYIEEKLFKFK